MRNESGNEIETDSKGKVILRGAHRIPAARRLHNMMVVQSRRGWKYADIEKAIADANAGIVYDRTY